jgi:hypothetical protein
MSELDTPAVDNVVDPEPIDSGAGPVPVVRPVVVAGARSAEEIRADLAALADPEAAHYPLLLRLAGEVEPLLAEVERLNLALNGWEDDVQDLRAGIERLDRANAKLALDFAAVSVERDSLRGVVQAVRDLFSGGPDTPCRTVWEGGVECVSVPLYDLRRALAAAADAPQPEPKE